MKKIAVFDVCWTLYRSNTTIDFVLFYLKKKRFSRYLFFRIITFRLISIFLSLIGIKNIRDRMIYQLKGENKSYLTHLTERFFNEYLINKINEPVFLYFNKYRHEGYSLLLASASLDIIVTQISQNENIDFVSSVLGFDDDVCTGKLEFDATGVKYKLLKNATKYCFFDTMFSDNLEDKKMKIYFNSFYFVCNSKILKKSKVIKLD